MTNGRENTTAKGLGYHWQQACRIAKRIHPWVCCYCHHPIDPNATAYRDRWSGDHADPRCLYGTAIPEPRFIRPAHVRCNSSAGARLQASRTTGNPVAEPLVTSQPW